MPYTPASPLHTMATVRPAAAVSSAQRQRSSSRVMGVTYCLLARVQMLHQIHIHRVAAQHVRRVPCAARACAVMNSAPPGPRPTTYTLFILPPPIRGEGRHGRRHGHAVARLFFAIQCRRRCPAPRCARTRCPRPSRSAQSRTTKSGPPPPQAVRRKTSRTAKPWAAQNAQQARLVPLQVDAAHLTKRLGATARFAPAMPRRPPPSPAAQCPSGSPRPAPRCAARAAARPRRRCAPSIQNRTRRRPPPRPPGACPQRASGLRSTAVPPASIFADTRLMRGTIQHTAALPHGPLVHGERSVCVRGRGDDGQRAANSADAPGQIGSRRPGARSAAAPRSGPHSSTATTAGSDALFPA